MTRRHFALLAGTALASRRIQGANDRIRLGALGTGGRCQYLMRQANRLGGCEFVAVNDVNSIRCALAKETLAPTSAIVPDFRAVLDDKSIDAVVIGSPDHWHVPMLRATLSAGKDAYCEKPLTKTIEEGDAILAAMAGTKSIVQVGYQQRSYPHMQEARQLIKSGEIGVVPLAECYWYQNYQHVTELPGLDPNAIDWKAWLGTATPRAFDQLRYRRWRWFWDYGGGTLTDLFSHWIDTIHWILDESSFSEVRATGGNLFFKDWECPDTLSASYRYPSYVATYNSTLVQSYEDGGMIFRGSKGTLKLDRTGYKLFAEADVKPANQYRPEPVRSGKPEHDGAQDHMANFFECVRSRKQPNSTVASAIPAANAAHYGNLAFKTGLSISPEWKATFTTPFSTTQISSAAPFRPLFNGRDLKNWNVDTKHIWKVKDGVIIGQHKGLDHNDFLRTKESFGDFELKAQFRLMGGVGNSGIQFRSVNAAEPHEVSGYQADVGEKYWGCLYDESRRKRVLVAPPPEALATLDRSAWNEYVIRAQGNFITLHLNGIHTVYYIETELVRKDGFIALQVHQGPGIEVQFKDIQIRNL